MRAYLIKVICAALVCSLTDAIAGAGPGRSTRRLICGAFLALTVLSPIGDTELPRLDLGSIRRSAEAAVDQGVEAAQRERMECISGALETYIWNKAAEMEMELLVLVELSGEGLPIRVELTGPASPLQRQELTGAIVRELGVREEDVIWTGQYQSSA